MNDLKSVLNYIGEFQWSIGEEKFSVQGILVYKDKEVCLRCSLEVSDLQKMSDVFGSFRVWGNVMGTAVTLLNCRVGDTVANFEAGALEIIPEKIIVGKSYPQKHLVKKISMLSIPLTYFFAQSPLEPIFDDEKQNILKMRPHSETKVTDKYGELRIYQTYRYQGSCDKISYDCMVNVEYLFQTPVDVQTAISRLASVRNLFAYFANHYIPLEKIECWEETDADKQLPLSTDFSLYFNWAEDVEIRRPYFLLTEREIGDDFQKIWRKWLDFYEDARPVSELFYEIICDRSQNTNKFLNLSQALEVYSLRYREQEAKKVAKQYAQPNENGDIPSNTKIYLSHRLEDIIKPISSLLGLDKDQVHQVAYNLAEMRNYFTHYNVKKNRPTYSQLYRGSIVLEFTLLVTIYMYLGIPAEKLTQCAHIGIFASLPSDITEVKTYRSSLT